MGIRTRQWHLLTYDVRCPKRLKRLHRQLKSRGIPVQRSVFLVFDHKSGINEIIKLGQSTLDLDEDEFALFQTDSPESIWRYGCDSELPLRSPDSRKKVNLNDATKNSTGLRGKLGRVLLWKD